MALKADLHVGDKVTFLRSADKAVSLAGEIVKIHDDEPVIDVKLDDHENWIETAHVDDVTVVEVAKEQEKG